MKKMIFSGIGILAIATAIALNVNLNKQKSSMSLLSLANVEALAQSENGDNTTWQVGTKKTITTTSPGWSYDISAGFWIFNGKRTTSFPPSSTEVTVKCCRLQGDQSSCPFESC